jgi:DnaJ-class molecular chaperone
MKRVLIGLMLILALVPGSSVATAATKRAVQCSLCQMTGVTPDCLKCGGNGVVWDVVSYTGDVLLTLRAGPCRSCMETGLRRDCLGCRGSGVAWELARPTDEREYGACPDCQRAGARSASCPKCKGCGVVWTTQPPPVLVNVGAVFLSDFCKQDNERNSQRR